MSAVETAPPHPWLRYCALPPLSMREKDSSPRKMLVPTSGGGSPKQASVYPLSLRLPQQPPDDDLPFDLSRHPRMSPAGRPQGDEEQPLDLRVETKKTGRRQVEDENRNLISPEASDKEEGSSPMYGGGMLFPPQPLHPMMLEAMYREKVGRFGYPPSPRYPFLTPMLSPTVNQVPFDLLRNPSPATPKVFENSGGKIKDRYACKFCGKVFPRSANLTRHLRTHTGEQPYKCRYCERSFSISSNLQRHVRNIHNKEKPFKCPLCERCFGQQTNLDRHLKKHEADGPTILDERNLQRRTLTPRTLAEESYFEEIRSFMGKVTDGRLLQQLQPPKEKNDEGKRDSSYFSDKDNFSTSSGSEKGDEGEKVDDGGNT